MGLQDFIEEIVAEVSRLFKTNLLNDLEVKKMLSGELDEE